MEAKVNIVKAKSLAVYRISDWPLPNHNGADTNVCVVRAADENLEKG